MPVKKYGNGPECYEAGVEVVEPNNIRAGSYVSARDGSYVYAVKKNGLQQESIAYPPTASKLRLRVLATKCVLPTHYISENRSFSGYHEVVNDVVLVDENTGTTYFAPSKQLTPIA